MNTSTDVTTPAPGQSLAGGFFVANFALAERPFQLIVAPKAEGEIEMPWNKTYKSVESAGSLVDGMINTKAMAAAGSKLAAWVLELRIGGFDDWYIPAVDELELIYRHLKPTTDENSCYMRSGINLSALPPTWPYTSQAPLQTSAAAFQSGGDEAFADRGYWASTQSANVSDWAWCQDFDDGGQRYDDEEYELLARAVRRVPI